MKLVQLRQGVFDLQWAWLPFWMGVDVSLRNEVERELQDVLLLNGATLTEQDADLLSDHVLKILKRRKPEAAEYLDRLFTR